MDDNGAPRMEMRALLAVVLSMLVLTLYQYVFVPPPEEPLAEAPLESPTPAATTPPSGQTPELVAEPTDQATDSVEPELLAAENRRITVRTGALEAVIDNSGAVFESIAAVGFTDSATGDPVDLVHPLARVARMLPLRLATPTAPEAAAQANTALYAVEVEGGRLAATDTWVAEPDNPVRVVLRLRSQGWSVVKAIEFPADGYQLGFEISASAPGGEATYVALGAGLNHVDPSSSNTWLCECGVVSGAAGTERLAPDDLEEPGDYAGDTRWAGVESHYFLGAFLLDRPAALRIRSDTLEDTLAEPVPGETAPAHDLISALLRVDEPTRLALYLGPKKYDVLTGQGYDLASVVDFGMFGIVARPMLALLNWIDSYVANYGLAIILLTVLLRLVFLPLNHRAMVSMRRTQKLQPQMAAIRAKYKGAKEIEKRQKMNEEVMELYRREGVSPFGGCLPMLAQLPILFAFYGMLSVAIELRGAPFALWIQDLSKHDPFLVLPLLMGGSMIVQQRMTPTSGINPAQARMMNLMPIMFTVLFLYVPSGLVLYWLVNNLLGIAQQIYVMRRLDEPAPETRAPKRGGKSQRGKQ